MIIFLCCLLDLTGTAQDSSSKAVHFQSSVSVGLLEGKAGSAFQLQTINVIRINKLNIGLGVGLDYYYIRSIPVFADVRQEFGKGRQRFFGYTSAGYHFPWKVNKEQNTDYYVSSVSGGLLYDLGVGYVWHFTNNDVWFSLGYSYKEYSEQSEAFTYCPFVGPCNTSKQTYSYQLRRLALKIGVRF